MPPELEAALEENTMPADPALVRKTDAGSLQCLACAHQCVIKQGGAGRCRMRVNRGGVLHVPGGYVAGLQADPIEKKPFFHVYPGRDALSFGMLGCNLHCPFCQNWTSSQVRRDHKAVAYPRPCEPEELVRLAVQNDTPVIVSTYNEPLITSDWSAKIFALAKEQGIECGYVSNGHASREVLEHMRQFMGLYKIDLKGFRQACYDEVGGKLAHVLAAIEYAKKLGYWVEVVTLLVPGFNDSEEDVNGIARFIAGISPDIPWHVTAYHRDYKWKGVARTNANDLERAHRAGREAGLHYVYTGNLPGQVGEGESTFCPGCAKLLIRRQGFRVAENRMDGDQCPDCKRKIPGVWAKAPPQTRPGAGLPRPLSV